MASDTPSQTSLPRVAASQNGERTTIVLNPAPTRERLRQVNWIGPGLIGLFIALTFWGPIFGAIIYSAGEREARAELCIVAGSLLPLLAIAAALVIFVVERRTRKTIIVDLGAGPGFVVSEAATPTTTPKPTLEGSVDDLVVRAISAGDSYKIRIRSRLDDERGLWLYAFSAPDIDALREALGAAGVGLRDEAPAR